MLTPQEVSARVFPKSSFGGYNMSSVDVFLDQLTEDYSALFNENAVLKNKMKVLVEKIEEYRSTEDAMRMALLTAQHMADDMVKDAEQQKAEILAQAQTDAQKEIAALKQEQEVEQFRLAEAQKATADFAARAREFHSKAMDYLDGLSELCPGTARLAEYSMDKTVSEIDESVQRLLDETLNRIAMESEGQNEASLMSDEAVDENDEPTEIRFEETADRG